MQQATSLATVPRKPIGRHGELRGLESHGRSDQFEGRFGRIFRTLPAAQFDAGILHDLAAAMTADFEATQTPETQVDDEENTGISAGYTYLGQFIDHDLTFDPASSLQRQDDPQALVDFRTPRFDLDNVYGRGPDDQPYLYRSDGLHMLLGDALTGNPDDPKAHGLPRNAPEPGEPARALIGDPRNDENVIVSQLQASMLRFHNRMADVLESPDFEHVQRQVRWHYQWVVLHDFLPTIIGADNMTGIFGKAKDGSIDFSSHPKLLFYKPKQAAFMPVEFSAAAYRFGHSMVRPIYRLNQAIDRLMIFSNTGESLVGFRRFPTNWAIDWNLFFKSGNPPALGPKRVQPAYKPDTSLVNPLGSLPASVAVNPSILAERNLLRGWRMGLPSGQSVARAMGVPIIPDNKLQVGKATEADTPGNKTIADISPKFAGNAPLWFYVLAEAQQQFAKNDTPIHLGLVGGRIIGEVIVGLLYEDSHSYVRQNPNFTPIKEFLSDRGEFKMADLLRQARQA
ncbi:MAG: heme peroxidase family protein [Candidatus Acidiferrales bacterium]